MSPYINANRVNSNTVFFFFFFLVSSVCKFSCRQEARDIMLVDRQIIFLKPSSEIHSFKQKTGHAEASSGWVLN